MGGLYEPVAGEQFDLIVAQPPYVFRPADTDAVTYLHGGALGDELATQFVAQAPPSLAPSGRAVLVSATVRAEHAGTPFHFAFSLPLGR